jgi:CobQ-like glutamine amidotransferase family enzyme
LTTDVRPVETGLSALSDLNVSTAIAGTCSRSRSAASGAASTWRSTSWSVRAVGNLVVRWGSRILVGFENHGGRTYLDGGARPFGRVLAGSGNNSEDGWEGCIHKNAIGTYMHGPAFPKNPALADHLIKTALTRRYGSVTLDLLDDAREISAQQRALQQATTKSGRWRRLWSDGVG